MKWIKITTDMFDNRKIRHLRKLPEGNNIVLIWVMLLTMAGRCNAGGMIFLTENIPYSTKMLADELGFEQNTVRLALEALERFGMICMNGDWLTVSSWEEHQNIDGMEKIREQNRRRQAKFKAKQKKLLGNVTGNATVTQGNATEDEKEEELEVEEDITPPTPSKETAPALFKRLLPDYTLSEELKGKMAEWLTYKMERKESYKETGLKSLLRQVEKHYLQYGDYAVCELIDLCMSSGWKGIIFDKLKEKPASQGYQKQTRADELKDFYDAAARWAEGSE